MGELSDQLMSQGDVEAALRAMLQQGLKQPGVMGLQEMLQKLRDKKQQMQQEYRPDSVIEDLHGRLQEIIEAEKESVQARVEEEKLLKQPDDELPLDEQGNPIQRETDLHTMQDAQGGEGDGESDFLEQWAKNRTEFLDNLPADLAGAIKELQDYQFYDAVAKQMFDELMDQLRDKASEGLNKMDQDFDSGDQGQQAKMQQMLKELQQMMSGQMSGQDMNDAMQDFMKKWQPGHGGTPAQDFIQGMMNDFQNAGQPMMNLLQSMSGPQREEMQDLLDKLFEDMGLKQEIEELQKALAKLMPKNANDRYSFSGDQDMDLAEALKMMRELGDMEELEKELRRAQYNEGLENIDPDALRELLGEDEAQSMEALQKLTDALKEAGFLHQVGDKLELTPKGMRRIGQKAMKDIFEELKASRMGNHASRQQGSGIELTQEAKHYEFGDPFVLDLQKTVLNAINRQGAGVPVKLTADDFDVFRTERQTQSSTVLMLDLSWSMARRGSFFAAKKVVLALHSLIKLQFPRDSLYVVGFSTYARELKADQLPYITWDQSEPYTNMQQGLMVSQKLLSKHKQGTKQILMISDGEPTAHMERGQVYLGYPPSPRTITETLREVEHCTRDNITINVFMLDRSYYLKEFVDQLTKINKGRAFYTSPESLGQYVMVDYLTGKRRKIA